MYNAGVCARERNAKEHNFPAYSKERETMTDVSGFGGTFQLTTKGFWH